MLSSFRVPIGYNVIIDDDVWDTRWSRQTGLVVVVALSGPGGKTCKTRRWFLYSVKIIMRLGYVWF